jgi:hypothetical protein
VKKEKLQIPPDLLTPTATTSDGMVEVRRKDLASWRKLRRAVLNNANILLPIRSTLKPFWTGEYWTLRDGEQR